MTSVWRRGLLILAVVVHSLLVGSVIAEPFDAGAPPTTPRFLTGGLSYDSANWPGPGADFFALYHAGLQARAGKSPHELSESPRVTPYYFRYIYSPVLATTLGRAATLVAPRPAYLLWVVVIEGCLMAWLWVLWRSPIEPGTKTIAAALLLVNQPYVLELHMGQFTFVAVVLALVGAVAVERSERSARRTSGAAALLAAATLLKTFPIATLPAFLRTPRGRRMALAPALMFALILAASAWSSAGPVSLGATDSIGVPHPGADSLSQAAFTVVLVVWRTWLPAAVPLLPGAIVAVVALWTGFLVLRRSPAAPIGAALMLLGFFLSYFHTWEHYYSVAILAGTALLLPGRGSVSAHRRTGLLLLLALLALPTPYVLLPRDISAWTLGAWLAMSCAKAVPLLGVFVIGVQSLQARPA